MDFYGCFSSFWVFMGIYELWVSTSVYEYLWGFMGVYGYLYWKLQKTSEITHVL